MSSKKYYWLKLNEDFFEDDTIQYLEEQENGKDYVIFYLKLCLKSIRDRGILIRYVGQVLMPYDIKALAKLTNTPVDTVAVALKAFEKIGLIERKETGEIYLTQIDEMIGSETESAKRKRKQRMREKQEIQLASESERDNVTQMSQLCHTDNRYKDNKDIDIRDIDIRDKDNNNNIKEKITIYYYYLYVKNNKKIDDKDLVISTIQKYGWKKVLYTLIYLNEDQKANISSFKYVLTTIEQKKEDDQYIIDYIVESRLRDLNKEMCQKNLIKTEQ